MVKKEFLQLQNNINHFLLDFSMAFHIPCYFYDMAGRQMGASCYDSRSNFCRFVHFFDTKQICRQSYLQSCIHAEEKKKPYTYFCPFGLINITYPILNAKAAPYFVTLGPLLFSEPDDLMINNILELNYTLKPRYREIRQRLNEIEVKSEAEVKAMLGIVSIAMQGLLTTAPAGILAEEAEKAENYGGEGDLLRTIDSWVDNYTKENNSSFQDDFDMPVIPFVRGNIGSLTKKDLDGFVKEMADAIFAKDSFELMKYRAMKYVESLMTLSENDGIHLELIFNSHCIDVEKFISCDNMEDLSFLVGNAGDRFTQCYLSSKELTNKDIIFQAMDYIRSHYSDITLTDVAAKVALSPGYFSSLFKKETGLSYTNYLNRIRIAESKRLLRQEETLSDIALAVGFSDQSYFSNVFRKCEGVTPNRWRNNH